MLMGRWRLRAARWGLVLALVTAALTGALGTGAVVPSAESRAGTAPRAAWTSSSFFVETNTIVRGSVAVPRTRGRDALLRVTLTNARLTAIPPGCRPSALVQRYSFISADGRQLTCRVSPQTRRRTVGFAAAVDGGVGERVGASVSVDGRRTTLPAKRVAFGNARPEVSFRFLSSPDFLNADVGDLAQGPGFWKPGRRGATANSTNPAYEQALDTILDDWQSLGADQVLVAGDLVEGWWGTRQDRSGNFGAGDTEAQRRASLRRAAATYYPQWVERFARRGMLAHLAMGDHEFGDNDWGPDKRRLAPLFEREFAARFTRLADGTPRYRDRPRGSRHELTAYAWRPRPEVQMVTLNVFDITDERARIRLDLKQLRWLERVLRDARRDGVQWIVAQGHTPIIGPVRQRGSSGLMYEGGRSSELWQLFKNYGVDLYLSGEVHDVTALHRDGVLQLSHGGLFAFGLTNYLVADVYQDRMRLTLRDYDIHSTDAPSGRRLWESRPVGMPARLRVSPTPFTIGTAVLDGRGHLLERSGIMRPWQVRD
ncbi:metallophosphoesterase [Nocardioides psychrotolerans]|uniref:metallophosphoesterase family protein n=1 Tax=Nocardioides psychrotolerans TaxID=1005945 RepID=UPI003137F19D